MVLYQLSPSGIILSPPSQPATACGAFLGGVGAQLTARASPSTVHPTCSLGEPRTPFNTKSYTYLDMWRHFAFFLFGNS